MNYSRLSKQGKFILISWIVITIFFFTLGIVIGSTCLQSKEVASVSDTTDVADVADTTDGEVTDLEVTPIVTTIPEWKYTSLGEYRLTAYCSCEKCCGQWARNRPHDESGKPIIYTANGSVAQQGVTIAADTSVLPFGTIVLIDGQEHIVQDRGGAIKDNRIDVYFESHEEALQFGVQYKEVFMKEKNQ